jgi:hypothetical protein
MTYSFVDAYNRLTPDQKRHVDDRDRHWQMGRCFATSCARLRAMETPPEPKSEHPQKLGFADSQEVRASINHLENEITGIKRMSHTHDKINRKKREDGF